MQGAASFFKEKLLCKTVFVTRLANQKTLDALDKIRGHTVFSRSYAPLRLLAHHPVLASPEFQI